MQSKGIVPTYEPAISKAFGTETVQRVANAGLRILGPYGQLEPGSKWVPLYGEVEYQLGAEVALPL